MGSGTPSRFLRRAKPSASTLTPEALAGQDRPTVVADMRDLPFPDASFASVLAVQSIEHVPDPERVLEEVVRVLEPGGTAVLVTPNRLKFARPDEIIDPYHYVEYAPAEVRALCERFFAEVEVLGIIRERPLARARRRGARAPRPPASPRSAATAPARPASRRQRCTTAC